MEWGEYARKLEKIVEKGKRVPALENRPELFDDLVPVWQAFNQLHSGRQSGFGISPLRTSDILAYLKFRKIEDLEFYELILTMDNEWLKWASNKQKQEQEAKKKKGK